MWQASNLQILTLCLSQVKSSCEDLSRELSQTEASYTDRHAAEHKVWSRASMPASPSAMALQAVPGSAACSMCQPAAQAM